MLLSKMAILAADDLKFDTVDVPEWGGKVRIKAWTVAEADAVGKMITEGMETGYIPNFRETIAARSVVDTDGVLLFSLDEIEALGKKSPAAINRIHKAALALNKLEDEDSTDQSGN